MLLAKRFSQKAQPHVSRHLSFMAAIVTLALGCSDDMSQPDRTMGAAVHRAAPSAATSAPTYAFTTWQEIRQQFTFPAGDTYAGGTAYCPPGTQVTGGGLDVVSAPQVNWWVNQSWG